MSSETSETKGLSEVATDSATFGIENSCKEFRSSKFDPKLCTQLKAGIPTPGLNTDVCRFYCDASNSCVSPFQSAEDLHSAFISIANSTIGPSNLAWAAASEGNAAMKFISQVIPLVQKNLETWKPALEQAQAYSNSTNTTTNTLCIANIVRSTALIIQDLSKFVDTRNGKISAEDYGSVSGTNVAAKSSCRVATIMAACAAQLDLPQVAAPATAISVGCNVGNAIATAIQCQQARDCCLGSIYAASPIETEKRVIHGKTVRTCCRCQRETWHDRTYPLKNIKLKTEPWGSVVTKSEDPVPECEGRNNKIFYHNSPDENNRWTYDVFTDCKKVEVVDESCWISNP